MIDDDSAPLVPSLPLLHLVSLPSFFARAHSPHALASPLPRGLHAVLPVDKFAASFELTQGRERSSFSKKASPHSTDDAEIGILLQKPPPTFLSTLSGIKTHSLSL